MKENRQIEYNSSLKSLALNYRSVQPEDKNGLSGNSVLFNFYLSDLLLENSREKLLELKHINIDAKVQMRCFYITIVILYRNHQDLNKRRWFNIFSMA